MKFDTKDQCVASVKQKISSMNSIPPEIKEILLDGASAFAESVPDLTSPQSIEEMSRMTYTVSFPAANTYWIMKDEELKLIESLAPNAVAIAGLNVAAAGTVAASPVVLATGLIATAVILFYRARKKGAFIPKEDYSVIMALKHLRRSTPTALSDALNGSHIYSPDDKWTPAKVEAVLEKLQKVPLSDGSIEKFVGIAADGLWSVCGA